MILVCIFESFKPKRQQDLYATNRALEKKSVALITTSLCLAIILYVPVYIETSPLTREVILCVLCYIIGGIQYCVIFIPKLNILLFEREKNVYIQTPNISRDSLANHIHPYKHDGSHAVLYESRRSSRYEDDVTGEYPHQMLTLQVNNDSIQTLTIPIPQYHRRLSQRSLIGEPNPQYPRRLSQRSLYCDPKLNVSLGESEAHGSSEITLEMDSHLLKIETIMDPPPSRSTGNLYQRNLSPSTGNLYQSNLSPSQCSQNRRPSTTSLMVTSQDGGATPKYKISICSRPNSPSGEVEHSVLGGRRGSKSPHQRLKAGSSGSNSLPSMI